MKREAINRLLGELEMQLHADVSAPDLVSFAGRPVDFGREVLRRPAHLRWQCDYLDAGETYRFLAVRSCNSAGKTSVNLEKAIYECCVRGAVVLYGSATWRQNRQQGQRELARLLRQAPSIKGDLYSYGFVPENGRGVIYFVAADDVNALQGYHDDRVVVILDEFQGQGDDALDAALANVAGGDSQLIVTGNPLEYGTAFHGVFQRNNQAWWKRRVDAFEILDDPAYASIPGLVTREWVNNVRQEWGEDSSRFQSRVWANFPKTPDDAFFAPETIAAAFARHGDPAALQAVAHKKRVMGIDVGASSDGDETVIAIAKGGYVFELVSWREADTMRSVGRIIDLFRQRHVAQSQLHLATQNRLLASGSMGAALLESMPGDPLERIGAPTKLVVDEIGVGRGVSDRLKERGYRCEPFNASRRPTKEAYAERYQNLRAEAYDRFRTMLAKGRVALPADPLLEEELRTCRGFTNSSGRLQIISKGEWRAILGRSPDRLDAAVLATAADGTVDLSHDLTKISV